MMSSALGALAFVAFALLAAAGGAVVAFSRNIVRSAFALLASFLGVAGLYAILSADFVAVIQVLVYVGGISILILFAVMLTSRISEARISNTSLGLLPGGAAAAAVAGLLIYVAVSAPWPTHPSSPPAPTTGMIGDALLGPYVLPFELVSVLLFAALIGAVTLARGRGKPEPASKRKAGEVAK